jgi:glycosyltransferase involved in cell wall biosynthesis
VNILLMLAHSIEEYDQVRLLSSLGYDVFSIGAYIDPSHPLDDMRPPLPDAPHHPELKAIVDAVPATEARPDRLWNAKDELPDDIIDWADVIICHHVESRWLWPQWDRIKHKRVIWRTVGQSLHVNEWQAQPYFREGCEIVRYSPKERAIPNYAGESALIRFYKDPDEYHGWTGEGGFILSVHQNPLNRGDNGSWVNLPWALEATTGLPVKHVGPGTELMAGGVGKVSPEELKAAYREAAAMIYTGTQPASLTLALLEALMTGTPIVSIGPSHMQIAPYGDRLFEGHEIAPLWSDHADTAREMLARILTDDEYAAGVSQESRNRALREFSMAGVGHDWVTYLGAP